MKRLAAAILEETTDWFEFIKERRKKKNRLQFVDSGGGGGETDMWQLQDVTLVTNNIVHVLPLLLSDASLLFFVHPVNIFFSDPDFTSCAALEQIHTVTGGKGSMEHLC